MNEFLTSQQAARILGIHPNSLKHYARTGRVSLRTWGKHYVWTQADIDEVRRIQQEHRKQRGAAIGIAA